MLQIILGGVTGLFYFYFMITNIIIIIIVEFDDGSDWTLSKGLTHANHTLFYII